MTTTTPSPVTRLALSGLTLDAIQAEATRAHLRHGTHSLLNPDMSDGERLAILTEEIGEVAHALTYDSGTDDTGIELQIELIQVAAVAASWVEALTRAPSGGEAL
ncbi:MAG: hypothetical protein ACJ73S_13130 [Mycobacteriales bacterium]